MPGHARQSSIFKQVLIFILVLGLIISSTFTTNAKFMMDYRNAVINELNNVEMRYNVQNRVKPIENNPKTNTTVIGGNPISNASVNAINNARETNAINETMGTNISNQNEKVSTNSNNTSNYSAKQIALKSLLENKIIEEILRNNEFNVDILTVDDINKIKAIPSKVFFPREVAPLINNKSYPAVAIYSSFIFLTFFAPLGVYMLNCN